MTKINLRSPHMNVGQFSNTSFLKPIVRWQVQGTDFQSNTCALPITVSIHDLPLLTERNENSVRYRFMVKLNVNKYRCTCKEMTSATMELWQKARQKFADPGSSKATDSTRKPKPTQFIF